MLVGFKKNIARMPAGKVFTTAEVMGDAKNAASANRLLGMMREAGTLRRVSRGRYYKPEESEFGTIPVETLRKSLNGLTTYPLNINLELLPNQSNWNIV